MKVAIALSALGIVNLVQGALSIPLINSTRLDQYYELGDSVSTMYCWIYNMTRQSLMITSRVLLSKDGDSTKTYSRQPQSRVDEWGPFDSNSHCLTAGLCNRWLNENKTKCSFFSETIFVISLFNYHHCGQKQPFQPLSHVSRPPNNLFR